MTLPERRSSFRPARSEPDQRGVRVGAVTRLAVTVAAACLAMFVFGFALFAATVMRDSVPAEGNADGIVVLTGGDFRILEGARLLQQGRATRMLISGVDAKTSRDDLIKLSGLAVPTFDCCVDLGYFAQNTVGNAEETRSWAESRKLRRLIVVTSSYHMPRSLAELSIALPGIELIPAPVVPRKFRNRAWWLHAGAARIMLSEYVKYLPVAAKLQTMRYVRPWVTPTIAADRPAPSQS